MLDVPRKLESVASLDGEGGGSPELTCDRDHIGQTVRIFILMYLCIFVLV